MIQAQRAQYNESVENELKNQALMSQTTIIVGPDDKKAKINWFYLEKIVLGPIRGDQFLYIFLLNLITSLVPVVIVFFPQSLSLRSCFPFILSSFFHLHPPHVDQVVGIDPCPISTFLKSLGVAVRLKITNQVSFPH